MITYLFFFCLFDFLQAEIVAGIKGDVLQFIGQTDRNAEIKRLAYIRLGKTLASESCKIVDTLIGTRWDIPHGGRQHVSRNPVTHENAHLNTSLHRQSLDGRNIDIGHQRQVQVIAFQLALCPDSYVVSLASIVNHRHLGIAINLGTLLRIDQPERHAQPAVHAVFELSTTSETYLRVIHPIGTINHPGDIHASHWLYRQPSNRVLRLHTRCTASEDHQKNEFFHHDNCLIFYYNKIFLCTKESSSSHTLTI